MTKRPQQKPMQGRLCVIGNSHIAALKLGWDRLVAANDPDGAGIAPTFFGAPSDGMRHVQLQEGDLVPTRPKISDSFKLLSGGYDRIPLGSFDAFLLVGLNVSSKRILRFYKGYAWVGLKGTAGKTLVHPAFAEAFLAESDRTASMIGHAASAALAPHATFVPQPEATIADGVMTRTEYNKDALRLISGAGGGPDASHMNADFGLALWRAVALRHAGVLPFSTRRAYPRRACPCRACPCRACPCRACPCAGACLTRGLAAASPNHT